MHFHELANPRNLAQSTCDGAYFVLQYNIGMSIKMKSYVFKLNVMFNKPIMMQKIIKVSTMSKNYSKSFSHTWFAYHNTFDTIFSHILSWQQQNHIQKCFDFEQSLIRFGQFLVWESCR